MVGGKLAPTFPAPSFPDERFKSVGEKQQLVAAAAFLQHTLAILPNQAAGIQVSAVLTHQGGKERVSAPSPNTCQLCPPSLCAGTA